MNPTRGGWFIAFSLAVALLFGALHLPEQWPQWLGWLRPAWVTVVIFFWVLELPHRVGLFSAWLIGLFVDTLNADPIGLNGFLLAGVTYVTWKFYERLRMYSVLQQCFVVFGLVAISEAVRNVLHHVAFERSLSAGPLSIAVVSAFIWPFAYLILLRLSRQFRVE